MRISKFGIIVFLVFLLFINSSVSSAALTGMGNIDHSVYEAVDDGEKTSTNTTQKNLRLSFSKYINELLSYNLELRTSFSDTDTENPYGLTNTTSRKTLEPAFNLSLKNSMYEINAGFRRRQDTNSGTFSDTRDNIQDYYYTAFRVNPVALPSLSAEFNRENNNDGVSVNSISDRYSFNSFYTLPSQVVDLRMYLNYTHRVDENPLNITYKSVSDDFSGNYRLGHSQKFLNNKIFFSAVYDGNFTRSTGESFSSKTGNVLFERAGVGLSAQGTALDPDIDILSSEPGLTDSDLITSTGIGLSSSVFDKYQNIGIQVSKADAVDRLYIYVNKDVSGDLNLTLPGNWKVYWSDFNQAGTWNLLSISSVSVSVFDSVNNIYRYEIQLAASTKAVYFKAVNMAASGVSNVFVTQVEAYGVEIIPVSGVLESDSTSIFQRIDLMSTYQPFKKLKFAVNYSIDKSDQNPSSAFSSVSSIITSIFSKSGSGEDAPDYSSRITKSFALSSTWRTHRLLTTDFRMQFTQTYDNAFKTDSVANSYSLKFAYAPIEYLNANMSLNRTESINFEVKQSNNDSISLTIGSRLYRYLNMVTDLGYSRSENLVSQSQSSSKYISGTIDTDLTKKLSGALRYSFGWSTTDAEQVQTRGGSVTVTYRPGRFVNLSGDINYSSSSDGSSAVSEIFIADWRPIPVIQLGTTYRHSDSKPYNFTTDSVSLNGTWHIKRFADFRTSYLYEQKQEDRKSENNSVNGVLSLRF
ncbi:MAG: hypothetical protein HY807_06235 [Nitrospirae bacterium]|nr:hypothetical protein [Nitrospirota bacterium]